MAETLTIRTANLTEVVKIASVGPQGPKGDKGDPGDVAGLPLTTQGDTLYRGASQNERLPIGTSGQILKVSAGGIPTWANESGAVSSVAGKTGVVTLDKNDVGLGNVSNTAQVTSVTGTAPIVSSGGTTPAISVTVGTTANTVCAGDDARLSDARTPSSTLAHASTHHTGGTDALAAHQINGQTIFSTGTPTYSTDQTLGAARALQLTVSNTNASGINLTLPIQSDGTLNGDTYVIIGGSTVSGPITIRRINVLSPLIYETLATITATGQQYRFRATGATTGGWTLVPVDTHTHPSTQITGLGTAATQDSTAFAPATGIDPTAITGTAVVDSDARLSDSRTPTSHSSSHASAGSDPLAPSDIGAANASHTHDLNDITRTGVAPGDIIVRNDNNNGWNVTSGAAWAADNIGPNDISAAHADHTHGNLTNDGKVGSTAGLPLVTTTAGAVTTLALGTAGQVLTVNSGANGVEFAAASGGGVTGAAASASDVLGVSGSDITGVDATADRIVFWDDSASALKYLEAGSGLSISGTTLTATGGGVTTGSVDNAIIRADGTGGSTSQGSAFVIPDNATASPNNTVNHASIQATGDTTNVSVSIVPKGTGAFMLRVPDSASTGGNARGVNAVDLMLERLAANQVASGEASFAAGARHVVSGTRAAAVGGYGSTASGNNAVTLGALNTATGETSGSLCGYYNDATASEAVVVGGNSNDATAARSSVIGGNNNTASADSSICVGGQRATANRFCIHAHAAGQFAAGGDAQRIRAVLRCKTTTNAAVEMALDGSATYLTIPSGKVIFCNIKVVGVKSDGSVVATYERQYAAKNVAGTSSEVFAPVTIGTDNASSTSLEVATVDAGDYIRIRPTGIASETWRWVASVDAVEVAYGS